MINTFDLVIPVVFVFLFFGAMLYVLGIFVLKFKIHIGYSRKISHFSMLIIPQLTYQLFNISAPSSKILVSCFSSLLLFAALMEPIRSRLQFIDTMHTAIDRPEDKPYTLRWLTSQTFIAYFILLFFNKLFISQDIPSEILYITLLTIALGDGLAEPIGVKFGKHKYSTKGFFVDKKYTRSIEGSMVVLLFSMLFVTLFKNYFSLKQFLYLLAIYPICLTLTEAKSPHTWDTPFLLISGNTLIFLIWKI